MDFFDIKQRSVKNGVIEIYPEFRIGRIQDIMARGKGFYAIYDKENDIWSKDECLVQDLIDKAVQEKYEEVAAKSNDKVVPKYMRDFSTKIWTQYRLFISTMPDNFHQLDSKLTFKSDPVTRKSYISKKLPYDLAEGPCKSFDKLMSVLYDEEERTKIEWMIGSIVSGDSREIQKFFVFYGGPGTGKSTVLNIIQQLFEGYFIVFDAKALATASNQFSMEMFREDPLVAIQHDGDLSRIDDNTKINSIVSHELMTVNEKFKAPYTARANCVLIMATNKPVKITDSNSGIMRRLIDIHPTGKKIKSSEYEVLMERIPFELGEIANRCLKVYRELGKNYYKNYIPMDMVQKTDVFFNFIDENYETFLSQDNMSLKQAYDMYKTYCDESALEFVMPKYKFKEELKNYYEEFEKRKKVNGMEYKNIYSGFKVQKLQQGAFEKKETPCSLVLDKTKSILDDILKDEPAQYGNDQESPTKKWSDVDTTLKDIDTKKLHYVRVPLNHIVIDFDLKNDAGEKSAAMNLEAASKWPPTYAEFSKGGNGVHLHYIYDGDPTKLKNVYSDGIEIKVFNGKSSLRRRLSKCNDIPIATISTGLPEKGEKMIDFDGVKSEKGLRQLIEKNLNKEIHPGTKPSVDFIYKILEDTYASGLHYDVTDMRPRVMAFANNSTHQSEYCIKLVNKMKFKSEETSAGDSKYDSDQLVFFDVEVFPNLFLINWKYAGDKKCVRMINPTPQDVEKLLRMK